MNAGGIKPLASLDAAMLGRRGLARRVPLSFGAPEAGAPEAGGPAEVPEVIRQVERLAAALGLDGPAPAVAEPGEPARRIAFTLRIDPARHARLRQVVAAEGRSAQLVLTDALDLYCGRAAAASSPAIIASHRTTPTGNQP